MMKRYEYHDIAQRGRIERVEYTTADFDGTLRTKYANVYLPYGCDAADTEKRYNILYVMHGGGGNADTWLDCSRVKNMLDRRIGMGEAAPLIVVFPSFYKAEVTHTGHPDELSERAQVLLFKKELTDELMPAVEGRWHTGAQDTTPEAFRASRMHRGFAGFSMGGVTAWSLFGGQLGFFSEFLPFCSDCWDVEPRGGKVCPDKTAQFLYDSAVRAGLGDDEYFIHTATGTEDPARNTLAPLIEALKQYPDAFMFSEDPAKGNLHFVFAEGGAHTYTSACQYLYHYLPYLFRR